MASFITIKIVTTVTNHQQCPNLSPCTCETESFRSDKTIEVECNKVPMKEVKEVFNNINTSIDIVVLTLSAPYGEDFIIPADLLGKSRVTSQLILRGSMNNNSTQSGHQLLRVDSNAFRSSNVDSTLTVLSLHSLNGSQLNLNFVKFFQNVSKIFFFRVSNLDQSLPTLPYMPALNGFKFLDQPGDLNKEWQFGNITLQGNGLTTVHWNSVIKRWSSPGHVIQSNSRIQIKKSLKNGMKLYFLKWTGWKGASPVFRLDNAQLKPDACLAWISRWNKNQYYSTTTERV